ncbi:hypothetical protein JRQ81_004266, partial [Phrynocephalus forsythii]
MPSMETIMKELPLDIVKSAACEPPAVAYLDHGTFHPPKLAGLLYANDVAVLSRTPVGLRRSLNTRSQFCTTGWGKELPQQAPLKCSALPPSQCLSGALLASLHPVSPGNELQEASEEQLRVHSSIPNDPSGLKVVGSTNLPVKVYVRLNHNSPRILCVTNHLRNLELVDPIFQWHGPGGDLVAENQTVKMTATGTLLFRDFKYQMSGVYTCSLVFKPTAEQDEKSYLIKYVIYVSSVDGEEGKSMRQKNVCDATRLQKVKELIENFFSQQVELLGKW